jgi:hypothetical protein
LQIQKNGAIKSEIDIAFLCEILLNFWNGCINRYIADQRGSTNLSDNLVRGFDAIMANVKVEKK